MVLVDVFGWEFLELEEDVFEEERVLDRGEVDGEDGEEELFGDGAGGVEDWRDGEGTEEFGEGGGRGDGWVVDLHQLLL